MTVTRSWLLLVLAAVVGLHVLGWRAALADDLEADESFFALEEQIVTLATKRPVTAQHAPAIISVITNKDICEHGYRSVGEALQSVAGFYAIDDQVFQNFGVRGINAGARGGSRILKVMIDGQPVAFRSTSANFLGPELVPLSAVKKIEVVRGPGSALYGANAFLGVVNVVTRKGGELQGAELKGIGHYTEANAETGAGFEATVGFGKEGPLQVMVTGTYLELDRSGINLPVTSPSIAQLASTGRTTTEDDLAKPGSFYGQLNYNADSAGQITLHGAYQRLDAVSEFQDLGPLPSMGSRPNVAALQSRQQLDNGYVRLAYEVEPVDDLKTSLSVAYAGGGPGQGDVLDTGQVNSTFLRQYSYDSLDVTAEVGYEVLDGAHITLGFDHTLDLHELLTYKARSRASRSLVRLQGKDTKTFRNTGFFGQGIVPLLDDLTITLGLRYDDNSTYGSQVNGRAGLVYTFVDELSLKLLFGSSFQAPTPELLFGSLSQQGDILGNPGLDPQNALSWEAWLGYHTNRFRASVNGFFNKIDDLAAFARIGNNLRAENLVDLESYGFEAESEARLYEGDNEDVLALNASLCYQRTLQTDRDRRSPTNLFPTREKDLFPQWVIRFGTKYKLPILPLTLSLDNTWVDDRLASASNTAINAAPYVLDDYLLSTVTLATTTMEFSTHGFRLLRAYNLSAMLQVVDVFDEQPIHPGFNGIDYPSLGRRYVAMVGLRF
ncbi:TonB-dependent receptor plug domain-containing protein [Planctomycetota bacterium]